MQGATLCGSCTGAPASRLAHAAFAAAQSSAMARWRSWGVGTVTKSRVPPVLQMYRRKIALVKAWTKAAGMPKELRAKINSYYADVGARSFRGECAVLGVLSVVL